MQKSAAKGDAKAAGRVAVRAVIVGGRDDFTEVGYVDVLVEEEGSLLWRPARSELGTPRSGHALVVLPSSASAAVPDGAAEGMVAEGNKPVADPYAGMGPRERAAAIERDARKQNPFMQVADRYAGMGARERAAAMERDQHALQQHTTPVEEQSSSELAGHASGQSVALKGVVGESEVGDGGVGGGAGVDGGDGGVSLLVVGGFGNAQHLRETEIVRLPKDLGSLLYTLEDLWQQEEEARVGFQAEGEGGSDDFMEVTPGPKMVFKRSGVAAVVLGGVHSPVRGVYSFGGFDGSQAVKTVEVLAVSASGTIEGQWREVHMMKHARYSSAALELPACEGEVGGVGRIGVFGGFDGI